MELEVDWDLHAVVRGCCTTNTNPKQLQQSAADDIKVNALDHFFHHESISNQLDSTHPHVVPSPTLLQPQPDQLFDLFRPFIFSPFPSTTTSQPTQTTKETASISSSSSLLNHRTTLTPTPRSKRRKNQFKKVCEVPAEGLASDDKWSWRKYGQKPIKGSPYPRGYYRCSSSKGCPARKQVERSRTDPKMFIITYTSEHNHPAPTHRNSLAGVSRNQSHSKVNVLPIGKAGSLSSSVPTSPSDNDDEDMQQSVVKTENEYQLDEILGSELHRVEEGGGNDVKEEFLDDDFFEGLDDIAERQVRGGSMS